MIELGKHHEIPLTTLPDCHWGYLVRKDDGRFKVGITSNPINRFSGYATHDPDLVIAYLECFPSASWAKWWEKNVMFFAKSQGEWIGRVGDWFAYVATGYGRHLGVAVSEYRRPIRDSMVELQSEMMRRNGISPNQLTMLGHYAGVL